MRALAGARVSAASWTLADDAPVALAELDTAGRLQRANERFCGLVGREEAELLGAPLRGLLDEADQPDHERELRALVADGVGYLRTERYLRRDGAVVWATNAIERATDADGRPSLLLASQALAGPLLRAELARARAEAELRVRDEFLNVLSHELRSPLASILVWARLLRESGEEGAEVERGLAMIERSGRAIEKALDDIVQVAHIVTGTSSPAGHSLLDLRALATGALDDVREEAEKKGVALSQALPAEAVAVDGDASSLQQALARLLDNAVKFTPAGGGIEIGLGTSATEASIRVSDTGAGMSAGFLPSAFEPFRQDPVSNRARRGLGLGLTIVRHVVTQHGGSVSASSAGPGRGSTFTIGLPLAVPGGADAAPSGSPTKGT